MKKWYRICLISVLRLNQQLIMFSDRTFQCDAATILDASTHTYIAPLTGEFVENTHTKFLLCYS